MKMGDYLKKRRLLFVITVILIIVIIIVSVCTFLKKGKESSNVQEQDLKITYNITKNNNYPMTKEDGITNADYSTIVIKNNKPYDQEYKLVVKPEDNSTLELNKIYLYINNEVMLLSDLNNNIAYENKVKANEETSISFKTWVGLDLITNEDNDKIVNLKYEIIAK